MERENISLIKKKKKKKEEEEEEKEKEKEKRGVETHLTHNDRQKSEHSERSARSFPTKTRPQNRGQTVVFDINIAHVGQREAKG